MLDDSLVLLDDLLKLIDFLRERKRFASQLAMLRLDGGLAQRGGEGLIDFVIGEALGIARVLRFFGGNGEGGQSLRRLPGAEIDDGLPGRPPSDGVCPAAREGQMAHGIAGGPRKDDA